MSRVMQRARSRNLVFLIGEKKTSVSSGHEAAFRKDVLREIDLMYEFGLNPHILHLIGHLFVENNPLLVLEYCVNGDLLSFLREALRDHKEAVFSVCCVINAFHSAKILGE